MEQLSMDLSRSSREMAEEAMAQTLKAESEYWIRRALEALRAFGAMPGWHEFKMEDFRVWYDGEGHPPPHDHHVWGALTNRASRDGVISFANKFAQSVSPKTHGHWVRVWRIA